MWEASARRVFPRCSLALVFRWLTRFSARGEYQEVSSRSEDPQVMISDGATANIEPFVEENIDAESALSHHLFEIAVAQKIAQIPAHAQQNDLGFARDAI